MWYAIIKWVTIEKKVYCPIIWRRSEVFFLPLKKTSAKKKFLSKFIFRETIAVPADIVQ